MQHILSPHIVQDTEFSFITARHIAGDMYEISDTTKTVDGYAPTTTFYMTARDIRKIADYLDKLEDPAIDADDQLKP